MIFTVSRRPTTRAKRRIGCDTRSDCLKKAGKAIVKGRNHFAGSDVGIRGGQGVAMANADHMRERASRLLAMALNARDNGQIEYADRLTKQASDILDEIAAAGAVPPSPPAEAPQPAAQQQQQPRPKKD